MIIVDKDEVYFIDKNNVRWSLQNYNGWCANQKEDFKSYIGVVEKHADGCPQCDEYEALLSEIRWMASV